MILGLDFLCDQTAVWNFVQGTVSIAGVEHQLHTRSARTWCRRVVLGEDVMLAPTSESVIFTNVVFSGRVDQVGPSQWATAPCQPFPGVSVARALIPSRTTDIPVHIFNVNTKPVCLPAGTVVAQLDQVDVCENTVDCILGDLSKRYEAINRMVDGFDHEISVADRRRLNALLHEFEAAFSLADDEL